MHPAFVSDNRVWKGDAETNARLEPGGLCAVSARFAWGNAVVTDHSSRMGWRLRPAAAGDAAALAGCIDAAYARYAGRIAGLPPVSAGLDEDIAVNRVWVAVQGDRIVGGLIVAAQDGFLRLANVAVHPDCRGAGLGRALMARAEDEARRQGYTELRLTTHAAMPENVALYTHLGWRVDRTGGNKVFMRKAVSVASK